MLFGCLGFFFFGGGGVNRKKEKIKILWGRSHLYIHKTSNKAAVL